MGRGHFEVHRQHVTGVVMTTITVRYNQDKQNDNQTRDLASQVLYQLRLERSQLRVGLFTHFVTKF